MFYTTLLLLFGLSGISASTNILHIRPNEGYITIYAGNVFPMSVGGIIIAGGEKGREQYQPICKVPYKGYPSKLDVGEIPCGLTAKKQMDKENDEGDDEGDDEGNDEGNDEQCTSDVWDCGKRFDFDNNRLPISHSKFLKEVPYPDYHKFGLYPDVNFDNIKWSRIDIPVKKCKKGISYAISTTADECFDRPAMNTWIEFECIPFDITQVEETHKGQIDIKELQSLAKRMEENGMYGVEEYIDQIIMEVLIAKTNIFSKKVIELIKPAKGIILYGPPGTGKTTLAKNLANILGDGDENKIKMITSTEVLSKWHGQSEENIRGLFNDAINSYKKYGDSSPLYFVIIDEIDAILSHRGEGSNTNIHDPIVNQFLGLMDGLSESPNLIVIGITNRLDRLDSACLRPGRFGCKISIDLPTLEQRIKIWEKYHQRVFEADIIDEINCMKLAKLSDNFSGADIEYIFDTSIKKYIMNAFENNKKKITEKDLVRLVMKYNK